MVEILKNESTRLINTEEVLHDIRKIKKLDHPGIVKTVDIIRYMRRYYVIQECYDYKSILIDTIT
jgi:hypothetical protein